MNVGPFRTQPLRRGRRVAALIHAEDLERRIESAELAEAVRSNLKETGEIWVWREVCRRGPAGGPRLGHLCIQNTNFDEARFAVALSRHRPLPPCSVEAVHDARVKGPVVWRRIEGRLQPAPGTTSAVSMATSVPAPTALPSPLREASTCAATSIVFGLSKAPLPRPFESSGHVCEQGKIST